MGVSVGGNWFVDEMKFLLEIDKREFIHTYAVKKKQFPFLVHDL